MNQNNGYKNDLQPPTTNWKKYNQQHLEENIDRSLISSNEQLGGNVWGQKIFENQSAREKQSITSTDINGLLDNISISDLSSRNYDYLSTDQESVSREMVSEDKMAVLTDDSHSDLIQFLGCSNKPARNKLTENIKMENKEKSIFDNEMDVNLEPLEESSEKLNTSSPNNEEGMSKLLTLLVQSDTDTESENFGFVTSNSISLSSAENLLLRNKAEYVFDYKPFQHKSLRKKLKRSVKPVPIFATKSKDSTEGTPNLKQPCNDNLDNQEIEKLLYSTPKDYKDNHSEGVTTKKQFLEDLTKSLIDSETYFQKCLTELNKCAAKVHLHTDVFTDNQSANPTERKQIEFQDKDPSLSTTSLLKCKSSLTISPKQIEKENFSTLHNDAIITENVRQIEETMKRIDENKIVNKTAVQQRYKEDLSSLIEKLKFLASYKKKVSIRPKRKCKISKTKQEFLEKSKKKEESLSSHNFEDVITQMEVDKTENRQEIKNSVRKVVEWRIEDRNLQIKKSETLVATLKNKEKGNKLLRKDLKSKSSNNSNLTINGLKIKVEKFDQKHTELKQERNVTSTEESVPKMKISRVDSSPKKSVLKPKSSIEFSKGAFVGKMGRRNLNEETKVLNNVTPPTVASFSAEYPKYRRTKPIPNDEICRDNRPNIDKTVPKVETLVKQAKISQYIQNLVSDPSARYKQTMTIMPVAVESYPNKFDNKDVAEKPFECQKKRIDLSDIISTLKSPYKASSQRSMTFNRPIESKCKMLSNIEEARPNEGSLKSSSAVQLFFKPEKPLESSAKINLGKHNQINKIIDDILTLSRTNPQKSMLSQSKTLTSLTEELEPDWMSTSEQCKSNNLLNTADDKHERILEKNLNSFRNEQAKVQRIENCSKLTPVVKLNKEIVSSNTGCKMQTVTNELHKLVKSLPPSSPRISSKFVSTSSNDVFSNGSPLTDPISTRPDSEKPFSPRYRKPKVTNDSSQPRNSFTVMPKIPRTSTSNRIATLAKPKRVNIRPNQANKKPNNVIFAKREKIDSTNKKLTCQDADLFSNLINALDNVIDLKGARTKDRLMIPPKIDEEETEVSGKPLEKQEFVIFLNSESLIVTDYILSVLIDKVFETQLAGSMFSSKACDESSSSSLFQKLDEILTDDSSCFPSETIISGIDNDDQHPGKQQLIFGVKFYSTECIPVNFTQTYDLIKKISIKEYKELDFDDVKDPLELIGFTEQVSQSVCTLPVTPLQPIQSAAYLNSDGLETLLNVSIDLLLSKVIFHRQFKHQALSYSLASVYCTIIIWEYCKIHEPIVDSIDQSPILFWDINAMGLTNQKSSSLSVCPTVLDDPENSVTMLQTTDGVMKKIVCIQRFECDSKFQYFNTDQLIEMLKFQNQGSHLLEIPSIKMEGVFLVDSSSDSVYRDLTLFIIYVCLFSIIFNCLAVKPFCKES